MVAKAAKPSMDGIIGAVRNFVREAMMTRRRIIDGN
jgi:hypothetical protein